MLTEDEDLVVRLGSCFVYTSMLGLASSEYFDRPSIFELHSLLEALKYDQLLCLRSIDMN